MAEVHPVEPAPSLPRATWELVRDAVGCFISNDGPSRAASIAYYTLFSIAPVLLITIAIAGIAFGRDAAQGAIVAQLSGMMGHKTAEALQSLVTSAWHSDDDVFATILAVVLLVISATAVFGEVQTALNVIWKAAPRRPSGSIVSRLLRARLASIGVVIACGFVLTVSLAASAALAAVSKYLAIVFPTAQIALQAVDVGLSLLLISGIFAAMYKVLPDTPIAWRDVAVGAVLTTVLFQAGKYGIALYVASSDPASSFGAAGALIVFLVWVYYSALIFLLGAELTRAWARRWGSKQSE